MTFDVIETSLQDGEPVELYKFDRSSVHWYYTSAMKSITHDAQEWLPGIQDRSQLEATNDEERTGIKITVPRTHPIAEMYRLSPPSDVVTVTIYRVHYGDTDEQVLWMGRILSVQFSNAIAEISCEPVSLSLKRLGLRRLYSRACTHKLYGAGCNLNRTLYEVDGVVTGINGNVVSINSITGAGLNYYAGGGLEWETPDGVIERRMILSQSAGDVTITQSIPGLTVGQSVVVVPGCDHTLTTCAGKFNNVPNYGGMPFIPIKNPHGGAPIY